METPQWVNIIVVLLGSLGGVGVFIRYVVTKTAEYVQVQIDARLGDLQKDRDTWRELAKQREARLNQVMTDNAEEMRVINKGQKDQIDNLTRLLSVYENAIQNRAPGPGGDHAAD